MFSSPVHKNETRVIFSKKRTYKNGFTNTESNGFQHGGGGYEFKLNNNLDSLGDIDSEYYSDDDEVFMEGPNIDKALASKPLMHPRHRSRAKRRRPDCKCRKTCKPILCFLLLVVSLGSLMIAILYVSNQFSSKPKGLHIMNSGTKTAHSKSKHEDKKVNVDGCDDISVEDVWTAGFPKLNTESAIRLVDVNQDGILDIILGFGTGADGYYVPSIVCDIYFNGTYPCFGGVLAIEGSSGKEIWRHYSMHELFGINCNADLDNDGVFDCVCGGRAGAFDAISGKNGRLLWRFDKSEARNEIMNLYTAMVLPDQDGDGMVDVLAIHGGDPLREPGSKERLSGRIIFFSGRTGDVLRWVEVPDRKESYYSPQMYSRPDGTDIVLFGTGGETHGGSLWAISLSDLYRGKVQRAVAILTDPYKGVMTPPVLVDITGDGVEDIVMAMFNSTVMAINGADFSTIWSYHTQQSESYNTPAAGLYNDDDIPDFMIKYAHGPGYPLYYYSQTTVLDGRNGQPLLLPQIRDTIGAQSSPLTVSVEGRGNDVFLYWVSDCHGHSGEGGVYHFVNGTNVHEQSRSDYCNLRFKSDGYSKIMAINRHVFSPGATIYYSTQRQKLEHSHWINTTEEGLRFIQNHPIRYQEYMNSLHSDDRNGYHDIDKEMPESRGLDSSTLEYMYGPFASDENHRTSSKKGPNQRDFYSQEHNAEEAPHPNIARKRQNRYRPYTGHSGNYGYGNMFNRQYGRGLDKERQGRTTFPRFKREVFNHRNRFLGNLHITQNQRINFLRKFTNQKRKRRHVGPHDDEGIQRLLSTGTMAPTTLPDTHPLYNHSIELVFATFWFFPAKTKVLLPKDQDCIDEKLRGEKIRFSVDSPYYGLDHDGYQHVITEECLQKSGHNLPDDRTYQSQTTYDPFNVHMGQLTLYRLRLTCTCKRKNTVNNTSTRCGRMLPYNQQQWRAYMGSHGNSHWIPRNDHNKH